MVLSALGRYAIKIDHVAIAVRDLDASIRVYEALGFQVVERRETHGDKSGMVSAVLSAANVVLVLIQGTGHGSQVDRYIENYGPGVQHIAIEVRNLEALREELSGSGIEFTTTLIHGHGIRQSFTARDHGSGMMFEFIERQTNDGAFTDESVKKLFDQLERNDAY